MVEATAELRDAAPTLNWVDETRLHLTLKFIGEATDDAARAIAGAIGDVAKNHKLFGIHICEVGAFPNFRRARVVWMGIDREPRLELLHHDVEVACERLGFEVEGRPFRPHLTLARVRQFGKGKTDVEELRRLSRASRKVAFEADSTVQSIDLMRSWIEGAGKKTDGDEATGAPKRYERLFAAPLRSD